MDYLCPPAIYAPDNIWKTIFVLGSYEYLERLEGKIRKCLILLG